MEAKSSRKAILEALEIDFGPQDSDFGAQENDFGGQKVTYTWMIPLGKIAQRSAQGL